MLAELRGGAVYSHLHKALCVWRFISANGLAWFFVSTVEAVLSVLLPPIVVNVKRLGASVIFLG